MYNYLALPCTGDQTFQQCGSLCPQTCENIGATCTGGCAEGCFCPLGQVINQDGNCEDASTCERKLLVKYCSRQLLCIIQYCIITSRDHGGLGFLAFQCHPKTASHFLQNNLVVLHNFTYYAFEHCLTIKPIMLKSISISRLCLRNDYFIKAH